MKVAVTGADGQLGTDLVDAYRAAGHAVVPLAHADVRIEDRASVEAALLEHTPDLVINSAAMVDLEACEGDPQRAFEVNAVGPRNLAGMAAKLGHALVQISTDYVFDGQGTRPYREADPTAPLNVYATSKLAGEHFVRAIAPRHWVLRTSGLFGRAPCRGKGGLNFVELMIERAAAGKPIRVVDDERASPTRTRDLAENLVALTESGATGTYHMTSQGGCTWYEFAARIFAQVGMEALLDRASPGEFASVVRRPAYSVLDNAALRAVGLDRMPHWADALGSYLGERGSNRRSGS